MIIIVKWGGGGLVVVGALRVNSYFMRIMYLVRAGKVVLVPMWRSEV
jgi:hypothetical protein